VARGVSIRSDPVAEGLAFGLTMWLGGEVRILSDPVAEGLEFSMTLWLGGS